MINPIILKNGYVVNTKSLKIEKRDIAILDGKIFKLEDLMQLKDLEFIDVEGCYIVPGFIELDVQVVKDIIKQGIELDLIRLQQGVASLEAGGAGVSNFSIFKEDVFYQRGPEILSFLNISRKGLYHEISEIKELSDLMKNEIVRELMSQFGIICLIVRVSSLVVNDGGIKTLEYARILADVLSIPIMIYPGNPPPNLEEIFTFIKKGDWVTHTFINKKYGEISDSDEMLPGAIIGQEKLGISFETMKKFKSSYDFPFTICIKLYVKYDENPISSLVKKMHKLQDCGYPLEMIVKNFTKNSTDLKKQKTFSPGNRANLIVFELVSEDVNLLDPEGKELICKKLLKPKFIFREGEVVIIK
ncbi:hypothetical protein [Bacillus sp. AFS041924]|uniref:hypothetical protein n=1 Tax=Bacillus sp. AFS041924 TaxID=2033503 RepID=UPI000BFB15F1|nr:hypothetical protein [Bacillus sp. AFS041924]PGS54249.1 hypothetical protein COC46_05955 [Bacillus sp. AFS041924]